MSQGEKPLTYRLNSSPSVLWLQATTRSNPILSGPQHEFARVESGKNTGSFGGRLDLAIVYIEQAFALFLTTNPSFKAICLKMVIAMFFAMLFTCKVAASAKAF
ncbi:hypothetical protein IFR04_003107 [Cadophora malorum]|uniref:Uncharacterized protein n=1 Tax=Cadophora malorum TaxID=108018 RepID=A0A8H7WFH3_9HELO|nr:hypothetical protein IFR04_003107 [Cadophora malorum]